MAARSPSTAATLDLLVAGALILLIYTLSTVLDAFDNLYKLTRPGESEEFDELLLTVMLSPLVFIWFSYRRWRSAKREFERQLKSERTIRELERNFAREERLKALGTLAGGIAHEFRNLLLPVRLLSEATRDQQPPESQSYSNLEKVIDACRQAQILVDNILTFGQQKAAERRPIDLGSTVADALDLARISLRETIRVELRIEDRQAHTVFADPTQIYQIVFNLINNAADAMADEGGAIRISVESPQKSSSVILRVTDNGHGMDTATSDQAFDPFFTTGRRGTGSGMGLAVVHGIVSALGGSVEIESAALVGTEIIIALPSYTSEAVRVWSPPEIHEAKTVQSTNMDAS